MGVTRAHAPRAEHPAPSLLPAPAWPGRRAPSLLESTGGETEARREAGPGLRSCPGTEVVLVPTSRAPQTPPHFPEAAGLGEEEPGGRAGGGRAGGHPQEAALFLELRFKETQDAKLSPRQLWPLRWQPPQPGPRPGGTGSKVRAEGPAPHPGPVMTWPLLTTQPELLRWLEVSCTPHRLCSRCQLPFQSMSYSRLAQMAPPPGSPSLSNPGQMPPLQLTQPLRVSPTTALTSWSLPHQTGSEPPCRHRAGRGGLSIETVSRTPRP